MRTLRSVMVTILILSVLFVSTPTARAGSATHFTVRLENATIPWAFPPPEGMSDFCPEIPAGIHINPVDNASNRVKQASLNNLPDGRIRIVTTDLIKGTASDNNGAPYIFVYENNVTYYFDGSTVTAQMKDTFKLKGKVVNYTVGFNWRWSYLATGLEVVEVFDSDGHKFDLAVNPFLFATNDGDNENPAIIEGSWQRLNTRGVPFWCDPL